MIKSFSRLQSFNDGQTKTVSVLAAENGSGGMETFTFVVINETHSMQKNFAPNQVQTVTIAHTASGKGLVQVSAINSPKKMQQILDVDKQPGDDGSGT